MDERWQMILREKTGAHHSAMRSLYLPLRSDKGKNGHSYVRGLLRRLRDKFLIPIIKNAFPPSLKEYRSWIINRHIRSDSKPVESQYISLKRASGSFWTLTQTTNASHPILIMCYHVLQLARDDFDRSTQAAPFLTHIEPAQETRFHFHERLLEHWFQEQRKINCLLKRTCGRSIFCSISLYRYNVACNNGWASPEKLPLTLR